ncbi:TPA: DUF943 family protein [Citrobacter koseri]|nr:MULTISPECIES: DUF943 family protein [Citrobacter]EKX8767108.1 DUF943 family protein [Citrobacter koseri]ELJ2665407.1 DUF943 family protein [Citrobacter koseri]MBJ8806297.1 DUF943 family protein [Citrobacter koseri]MBJ8935841.1 DUF943 family protein [Citrobacter koseri]MBJ9107104.1 DUF943 family protein [Citrobacter koseri]
MKSKREVVIVSLVLLICGYLLWTQRPVTIFRAEVGLEDDPMYLHGLYTSSKRGFIDKEWYDIAVDHLALTEWGRIHWYLEHKAELKRKYRIPTSTSYSIAFLGIGSGFIDIDKSGDSDLYCFSPKKDTKENCIEKNMLLEVDFDAGSYERFSFGDSEYYWITMPDGKLVRIKNA